MGIVKDEKFYEHVIQHKDAVIEHLLQEVSYKAFRIKELEREIEALDDEFLETGVDRKVWDTYLEDKEDSSNYDLEVLQAKLLNKEEQLERNSYIIDALIEKIKLLECRIWDLEN